MFMDKRRDLWAEQEHNDHGNYHSGDHDLNVLGCTPRGNNTVERKNSIDQYDLGKCLAKGDALTSGQDIWVFTFQFAVDLLHRFIDQKQASHQHDDTGKIKSFPGNGENGLSFL